MSLNGLFAVRKPVGPSSAQVLNAIQDLLRKSPHFQDHLQSKSVPGQKRTKRQRLSQNKVKMGHGGTLDPMASGVLVAGIGSGTKELSQFLGGWKEYEAACVFGTVTDSYDAAGKILRRTPTEHITKDKVEKALEAFRGDILQVPPIFSALRIDGKRAYEYARSGQELPQEIKPREVKAPNLELVEWYDSHSFPIPKEEASEDEKNVEKVFRKEKLQWKPKEESENVTTTGPACKLRMKVSGGFYVRSLCYDLGTAVESGAYMAELVRIKQGGFSIGDAIPWEDFVPDGPWEEKLVQILSKGKTITETTPVEDAKDEDEKAKMEAGDAVRTEAK